MLERGQFWHIHKTNKKEIMISQGLDDPSEGTAVDRLIASVTNDPTTSWRVTVTKELTQIKSASVVGQGDRLITYFTNSLNKIHLCGNNGNTHWMSTREELPTHLKWYVPCSAEEEDDRAQFSNNDDAKADRDVRCPAKLELIPNVAGVTHDNEQGGAHSYMVLSQLSPGSDDGGDCSRGGVHKQGEKDIL